MGRRNILYLHRNIFIQVGDAILARPHFLRVIIASQMITDLIIGTIQMLHFHQLKFIKKLLQFLWQISVSFSTDITYDGIMDQVSALIPHRFSLLVQTVHLILYKRIFQFIAQLKGP